MSLIINIFRFPIKCILIGLIYFYKGVISPILPKNCAYYPTCSTFMLESIKEFGIIKGLCLGTKRLIRCNPKCAGGLDYVPYSIKGDNRWIY